MADVLLNGGLQMKRLTLFLLTITAIFAFSFTALAAGTLTVQIDTKEKNGRSLVKEMGWQKASLIVTDENGTVLASDDSGQVKIRGNSTAGGEKKPYNIRFSKKTDLFGSGAAKTYCLLANCFDPTLMRNSLALSLAKTMGLPMTPDFRQAEVYMDGVFMGSYQITGKIEAGKGRVDIDVEKGDFLLECERERVEDGVTYVTVGGFRFSISEPEEPDEEQLAHIQKVLDELYETCGSGNYDLIQKKIDTDSFAKYYVLNEYFKSLDYGYSSTYFYCKDGKLYAGPVWDYDLSSGNVSGDKFFAYNVEAGQVNTGKTGTTGLFSVQCWYSLLCKNRLFRDDIRDAFEKYSPDMKKIYEPDGGIDACLSLYGSLYERNYAPVSDGGAGWVVSKDYSGLQRTPDQTFTENVEYLRTWLSNRFKWLETIIPTARFDSEVHYGHVAH